MGRENFCLQCEHVWYSLHNDHCPKCGSEHVSVEVDWDDGHYEGDMSGTAPNYNIIED